MQVDLSVPEPKALDQESALWEATISQAIDLAEGVIDLRWA